MESEEVPPSIFLTGELKTLDWNSATLNVFCHVSSGGVHSEVVDGPAT